MRQHTQGVNFWTYLWALVVFVIFVVPSLFDAFAQDETEALPAFEELLPNTLSFTTAKKRIYEMIYIDAPFSFYCGCQYSQAERTVLRSSCGLEELESSRTNRVEAEHIVPASKIGATRSCWAEGGRDHCLKVDPVFKIAYSDLHNLTPAVGSINAARSNHVPGLIEGEERKYGGCDFEVDTERDVFEPYGHVRGDVARAYFYMEYMYGIPISEGQRRVFHLWNQQDPVEEWEVTRNDRIKAIQGNSNPFVAP